MKRSEYEQRRRALEEIHQADLGLIRPAHEARPRSTEGPRPHGPGGDAAAASRAPPAPPGRRVRGGPAADAPPPAPDARPAAAPRIARPPVAQALGDVL